MKNFCKLSTENLRIRRKEKENALNNSSERQIRSLFAKSKTPQAILLAGKLNKLIKSCPEGYELVENPISGKAECTCLPYHLYWPLDGICYRELTQGPCKNGHKLVWNLETEQAECQCPPFWTKLSPDADCYEEYTQGYFHWISFLK